jgi:hypothetical protein
MEDRVWVFSNPKGTFPGVPDVIHQSISATLANNHRDLFIDIFLQFLGIQMLGLLKQLFQLLINIFCGFPKNPIET